MATGGQSDIELETSFNASLEDDKHGSDAPAEEFSFENSLDDVRSSLLKDTYKVEFCYISKGARVVSTDISDEFVVRVDSDEKKKKLEQIRFSVTQLTVDHENRLVTAKHDNRKSVSMVDKWKKDVAQIIEKEGIEVVRLPDFNQKDTWVVVNVGLKAHEVMAQIMEKLSGVCCHLIQETLSLLLYSPNPKLLKEATDMATAANPSGGLSSEFNTPRAAIKVCFISADITHAPTEGVVSATDKKLSFSGGVSKAIKGVVDPKMAEECRTFLQANKAGLAVAQGIPTTGEPRWRYVLHTRGPKWPRVSFSQEKRDKCCELLKDTIYNCLKRANELSLQSIAIPFISSQAFRVPSEVCAESFKAAIEKFDQDVDMNQLTLKTIMFVDNAPVRVSKIQRRIAEGGTLREATTLRVVLVGRTGTGKSSTGNSILGDEQAFDSHCGFGAGTNVSRMARHSKINLEVVDTPGLFDLASSTEEDSEQKLLKEILKSVVLFLPGPHVFFLVFKGGERITKQEKDVLEKLKSVFSDSIMQHAIIIFTNIPNDDTLRKQMEAAPQDVKALLEPFGDRIASIDNKSPECKEQADKIIRMAIKLRFRNGGQGAYYKNKLTDTCLQLVNSGQLTNVSLDKIKDAATTDDPAIIAKLTEDKEAMQAAQNFRSFCNIL